MFLNQLHGVFPSLFSFISDFLRCLSDLFACFIDAVANFISDFFDSVANLFRALIQGVTDVSKMCHGCPPVILTFHMLIYYCLLDHFSMAMLEKTPWAINSPCGLTSFA